MSRKISLSTENHVQGGFLSDSNVTISGCGFYPYTHTKAGEPLDNPSVIFFMVMTDDEGKDHEQWYTAGSLNRLVPSQDGETPAPDLVNDDGSVQPYGQGGNWLIPATEDLRIAGVNKSTRFGFLQQRMKELVGFPDSAWDEHGAGALEGAEVHVTTEKMKRDGKDGGEEGGAYGKPADVVIIDSIFSCPAAGIGQDGKKAAPGAGKKGPGSAAKASGSTRGRVAGKSKAAAAPSKDEGGNDAAAGIDEDELTAMVIEVLGEEGAKKGLAFTRILKLPALAGDKAKKEAYSSAVMRGGFLDKLVEDGVLAEDGGTYTVA